MYRENRVGNPNSPAGWAKMVGHHNFSHLKLRLDRRYTLIKRLGLKGPILDAGCGAGAWVSFLAAHGYRAEGIDYSEPMTARNRELMPDLRWHSGDIRAMPMADNSFASIVSWGVIEHDEAGPDAALKEFRRVLKPGGKILVTVPTDSAGQRRASNIQFDGTGGFFQYFFTEAELAEAVTRCGFGVIETGPATRPEPIMIWPDLALNPSRRRMLQIPALFYGRNNANMIYCAAQWN